MNAPGAWLLCLLLLGLAHQHSTELRSECPDPWPALPPLRPGVTVGARPPPELGHHPR